MPIQPTYPGVYIEEIPSGVRSITGVSTSVTAFIGRTARGDVDEPVVVTSYADFERRYGGLAVNYPLTYAVRDFYQNGGTTAVIVRLYNPPAGGSGYAGMTLPAAYPSSSSSSSSSSDGEGGEGGGEESSSSSSSDEGEPEDVPPPAGTLLLEAVSPGAWGNQLFASVDYEGIDFTPDELVARFGANVALSDLFNITIQHNPPDGRREHIRNVTLIESTRRIDRVLKLESQLVRVKSKSDGETPDLPASGAPAETPVDGAVQAAGGSDGQALADWLGSRSLKTGMYALQKADIFNILCIPPDARDQDTPQAVWQAALAFCRERRAMLLVDPPNAWKAKTPDPADLGLAGPNARNAAVYFPRVIEADALRGGQLDAFVPCGIIAGVMARTDAERGVWKAPAGLDASLNGIQGLSAKLTDEENGLINPLGVNCLRVMPAGGPVVWGARTLRGADKLGDEYKYVPVRRTALFIEESLYRGTQWVVFEPNGEPLWGQVRLNVGAFMHSLFRQGAFAGQTPRDAYFVKCDKETTTQDDINKGVVNILVGFAPLKPAEFVMIKLQQMAGQIAA